MPEIGTLRTECRDARQAGDFERAARAGLEVWAAASDRDPWDAWNVSFALRKLGRSGEALVILWDGLKLVDPSNDPPRVGQRLASEFGWSAYDAELKQAAKPQPSRVARTAVRVVEVWDRFASDVPWDTQFCPVPLVVGKSMKLLKDVRAWAYLAEVVAATDGDRLPNDQIAPDVVDDSRGAWTRAEAWYTSAVRAYVEEDRAADAIALIDKGLARAVPLGTHCAKWLYFYGAKAAVAAGDGYRAVEFVRLARRNGVNDWWMGVFEADAHELAGDHVAAVLAIADAFLAADRRHVPAEFFCTALDTATRIVAGDAPELAAKCARVHHGIREAQGWSIPAAVEKASGSRSDPVSELAEIVDACRTLKRASQPVAFGTISRLISEGSGFLRGDDGVDRYFSFPRGQTLPPWCRPDQRVRFVPTQRFDNKSGQERPAAIEIAAAESRPGEA